MQKEGLRRRFFIAVSPPPDVAAKIGKIMLKGPLDRGWSWSRREDLHISLGFPGELTGGELEKLKDAMAGVVHRAFRVTLKGIDAFFDRKNTGTKQREHVLWMQAGSPACMELKTLHREIEGAMKKALRMKDGGPPFIPHMTLAKTGVDDHGPMKDFAVACEACPAMTWECRSFAIYETLGKRHPDHPANNHNCGSKYKKIAAFNLDG